MLHDPVQAFFSGMSFALARIPLCIVPLVGASAIYASQDTTFGALNLAAFPFYTLGALIWWTTQGGWFLAGLISLVLYCYVSWLFVQTDYATELFLLLFILAGIFFIPLSWVDGFSVPWALFWFLLTVTVYCFFAYGFPAIVSKAWGKENA